MMTGQQVRVLGGDAGCPGDVDIGRSEVPGRAVQRNLGDGAAVPGDDFGHRGGKADGRVRGQHGENADPQVVGVRRAEGPGAGPGGV